MVSALLQLLPLVVLLAAPFSARAQNEKALSFYHALLERPGAGALFEQFYNAWVNADTVEKLGSFLTVQAEQSPDSPEEGLTEVAESLPAEAAALLTQLAAALNADDSADVAVTLARAGHVSAAAAYLRDTDNYRMAWLAARLTDDAGEKGTALNEYLRLATTPFAPMPERLRADENPGWLQPDESLLTPVRSAEPLPEPGSDGESIAILRAMQEQNPQYDRLSFPGGPFPRAPGPLWQLRGWAAGHALRLAQEDGPAAVAGVEETLLKAGIRPAIFSEAIAGGKAVRTNNKDAVAAISGYPKDREWIIRFLLGPLPNPLNPDIVPVISTLWPQADEGQRPVALQAWRCFRASDPPYAIHAALMLMDSPVMEERAAAEEAITLLESKDHPGPLLAGAMPALTNTACAKKPDAGSHRSRLLARLQPWHEAQPPGRERDWLRSLRLVQLTNGNDPATYLNLLAEEIAAGTPSQSTVNSNFPLIISGRMFKTKYGPRSQGARPFYFQRHSSPSAHNNFFNQSARISTPGPELPLPQPGISMFLLPPVPSLWTQAGQMVSTFNGPLVRASWRLAPGPWSSDAAKLRAAVEQCPHAGLKALASLTLKDDFFSNSCMEKLAAAQPAVPEQLMIAAAWEWRQHRPEKAIALLEQAGELEPAGESGDADTAIVAAVNLLLWAEQPLAKSVRQSARAALERMTTHSISPECRGGLATIAESMGFAELSATLLKGPMFPFDPSTAALPSARPHPLAALLSTLQNASPDPAHTAKGQSRMAGLAAQFLLDNARQTIDPLTNGQSNRWSRSQQSQALYDASQLDDAKRKAFNVAVVAELQRRAAQAQDEQAMLAAGLAILQWDGAALALPILQKVLAKAPGDRRLRFVAAREMAGKSVPVAMEMAASLGAADRSQVMITALRHIAHGDAALLPTALNAAEEWLAALREVSPAEDPVAMNSTDLPSDCAVQILNLLEAPLADDKRILLPAFLAEESGEQSASAAAIKPKYRALAKRRHALLPALYRELLRIPSAAESVIQKLAMAETAGKMRWESRRDDALAVLLRCTGSPGVPVSEWPARGTTVEQIVLEDAVRDPAWLEQKVLPALRAAGKTQFADGFARLLPLLTCQEAEFAAAADRLARAARTEDRPHMHCQVVDLAGLRGFHALLPEMVGSALAEPYCYISRSLVFTVVRQLHAQGGQPAVEAWVEKVCGSPQMPDIWLRPAAPQGSPGKGFSALASLQQSASSNSADTAAGFRLLRAMERPLLALPKEINVALNPPPMPGPSPIKPAAIIEMLEAAGFLADLPDFRPVLRVYRAEELRDLSDSASYCALWLRSFVEQAGKNDASAPLLKVLEKDHAQTFGGRLAAAILREARSSNGRSHAPNPMKPEVLTVLAADLPRLQELPEERQLEFVSLGQRWGAGKNEKARPAEEWQDGLRRKVWQRLLAALLAMTESELTRESNLQNYLSALVTHLLPDDPENVKRLLARVEALSQRNSIPSSLRDTVEGAIRFWGYDAPPPLVHLMRLRAALALACSTESWVPAPSRVLYTGQEQLRRWITPTSRSELPESFDTLTKRLASVPADFLSEKEARMLLPLAAKSAMELTRDSNPPGAAKVAAALEAAGPGGRLREVLAQAVHLAALHHERRVALLELQNGFGTSASPQKGFTTRTPQHLPLPCAHAAADLSAAQQQLLETLTDNSLPVALRRALVASHPAPPLPLWFEPALVAAAAPLLEEDEAAVNAQRRQGEFTSAAALAHAALQFAAPQSEEGRAAERRIVSVVLNAKDTRSYLEPWWLLLAARSGDDAQVLDAVRTEVSIAAKRFDGAFRMLVNTRRFAAAGALLDDAPDKLFPCGQHPAVTEELYSPTTPQNLRDFLATLPDGSLRLAAEVLMATSWDAPDLTENDSPPRAERLRKLAETFSKSDIPVEWARRLANAFSNSSAETQRLLQPMRRR